MASSSMDSVVDLAFLGLVGRSLTDVRRFYLATVFGLMLWCFESAIRLSLLCCIRRITSVVVALPCRICPIANPSIDG
jgi:hypothetical protein